MSIRINAAVQAEERDVRRVFRNRIGDWCADIAIHGLRWTAVFDYHPTIATMRALREAGADIADDVIAEALREIRSTCARNGNEPAVLSFL
jgi:hypothetical protein